MPSYTYPPAPASLSGDMVTINRWLQSPAVLRRRLQALTDIGFVADVLLPRKFRTAGGGVAYEVDEPLFTDREITAVAPGSEYPRALPSTGAAALAYVSKWGQATEVTDERIKRSLPMGSAIDWGLRKVVNTVVRKVDRLAIATIASAVTATTTGTDWTDESASRILLDIETAKAEVTDLELGYEPDMILMSTLKYAHLASDDKIATLRRRESTDNPVYGGTIETIADLKVVKTPLGNLPGGLNDVWVLDSRVLGGMADEPDQDPGYATADNGVQVQTRRVAERDAWHMWARRITVPIVESPSAATRITGTNG